ncbi:helix-turn-helix transcriptional regulator [Flaviaesturariibacter amylovorans]|uniref:HTH cro/C1-type domain-containing protein n=1 Tax=Flaviaesturariibacter amylovorans TaxID=1084520 RepID=A0ABP8GS70_9BACT
MPGSAIRRYRELKNYSQKYVATQMGISQNAYSKIENNLTQLTVHHVKQLSEILQVPVTDLLRDDFEIHKPLLVPGKPIHKDDVIHLCEHLIEKLKTKHAARHDSYLVSASLLQTVDNLITHVY